MQLVTFLSFMDGQTNRGTQPPHGASLRAVYFFVASRNNSTEYEQGRCQQKHSGRKPKNSMVAWRDIAGYILIFVNFDRFLAKKVVQCFPILFLRPDLESSRHLASLRPPYVKIAHFGFPKFSNFWKKSKCDDPNIWGSKKC